MARTKYLKRSIKVTKAKCRFVNLATNEIISDIVTVGGVFKDVNKLFKAIDSETASGFKLISVDDYHEDVNLYRIKEADFIANAELIAQESGN